MSNVEKKEMSDFSRFLRKLELSSTYGKLDRPFPNAVYGCGHLSPIGWCGPCALASRPTCDGDHAEPPCDDPECWLLDDSTERADEYTETDDD